ncbi:MAG TPA: anthranilate synthase component I family protein, partial [Pyrinomonadaceae bacterium]|nr:anthranilate synthase component I family protein [Pyrinomonadaceae bacterium]
GSHLLIAGIGGRRTLSPALDELVRSDRPTIFTLSYELGARSNDLNPRTSDEPEIFAITYESLIVHDYETGETRLVGDARNENELVTRIGTAAAMLEPSAPLPSRKARSTFTRETYVNAVKAIQELVRSGDTYQTNLTQQITIAGKDMRPQDVFWRLRRDHPAPFAAFMARGDSTVVSASPERFFRVTSDFDVSNRGVEPLPTGGLLTRSAARIETSPIKGTRRRGETAEEDAELRDDLLTSAKDRAENTMIVDLLRNDLGRVCEYGSVRVDKLCELEEHPTLFHLVSTVSGDLREDVSFADIIRAIFPCGSITGAPKISTMRIIDEIERTPRGLSMGAIGYSIPAGFDGLDPVIDLSVAIRTMVFQDGVATFNVGGGITIDSDPDAEYDESLLKAKALLAALNATL